MIDNDKEIGIIGPKLLNEDGSIQFSCRKFYNLKYVFIRMGLSYIIGSKIENNILMKNVNHDEQSNVDWIS